MLIRSRRRLAAGGFGSVAVACAAAFAMAGHAQAATTVYPAGGSTFDGDAQGWVISNETCGPINPIALLCTTAGAFDGAEGNPPGSLVTTTTVTLNVLSVFTGTGTWTSPAFEVSAPDPVTGVSLSFDRRLDDSGALDLNATSTVVASLIDETAGTTIPLGTDELTTANSAFAPRTVATAPGGVVDGHTYRLQIATTTTSSVAGLLGEAAVRFDNIGLAVETTAGTGGPGGNGGAGGDGGNSPGVTVVRGPYGDSEIASIVDRFDIDAETGNGRDGSLIPLELCTILGTSGPDRITGTPGNDVICGLGGDDVISGVGLRDAIDGADGNDRLSGGIGGDLLLGLGGNDRVDGGADGDRIGGGAGNDRIEAGNGTDVASGASGNDAVGGEAGNDTLRGLAGNDRINGGPGRDRLDGGAGSDVLRGFSGNDRLIGGGGGDRLDGGSGRDSLAGGSGADRLLARDATRDALDGGSGRNRAVADRVDRISRVAVVSRR
jgi:Ca2+-binding RTX toxin-like protein